MDAWITPAGFVAGHIFRPVNRAGAVTGERLGEKVVWQMLRQYAAEVGMPGIAPHDLRRYAESRTMPNAPSSALQVGRRPVNDSA